MDSILGQILDQPAWLVYLIVGLVVFVEDALFVGFVVPGETVAVLGGVTASLGTTNVWLIGLIVVAAAVLGDSVGYEIGRVWGTQIIARPFFDKRLTTTLELPFVFAGQPDAAIAAGVAAILLRGLTASVSEGSGRA